MRTETQVDELRSSYAEQVYESARASSAYPVEPIIRPVPSADEIQTVDLGNNRHEKILSVFYYGLTLAITLVCAPIIALLSLGILITSGFPIFFIQKRVGLNGKTFSLLKFRTMVKDAHQMKSSLMHLNVMNGPFFKVKNDPRVTPFGKFLRMSSLDELPQLFNVLRGEMALVGPRPMLPEEVERLNCRDILTIRPGLTGIWQVSGRNEIVDFRRKLAMDRAYVLKRSFKFDLYLLWKTLLVVIRRRGAY